MTHPATTVELYLAALPEDRRTALNAVREVINANRDPDIEEGIQYGMIGYYVPHRVYPAGYHCDVKQPLPYAALASRKNHLSLSLMAVYTGGAEEAWFRKAWVQAGKKLDMGVVCIRFKRLDDLPLEVIAEAIRRVPARKFIELYETSRDQARNRSGKRSGGQAGRP